MEIKENKNMEDVKNAEELLSATMDLLREKKVTSKAKAEVNKRVLAATSGDKGNWNLAVKAYSDKGRAWAGGPLLLNKDEPHKDSLSPMFIKLLQTVTALEEFNLTEDILSDYLDALEELGIKITIDSEKFNHVDTDSLEIPLQEELDSLKSYTATIESYTDEIKNEHAPRAEELNFAPSSDYMKVVNIYRKGVAGKEIDDDVQDILTHNELLDSAVNLVADHAKSISAQASDNV